MTSPGTDMSTHTRGADPPALDRHRSWRPAGVLERSLLEDVEEALRQHGVVVWLDKDGHYDAFVDRLAQASASGEVGYPVVPFRGSYLEMMLALEPYGSELHPERLLIHMPGHNESSVRATPLLELYELGYRFRKALSTLVEQAATGLLSPAEVKELSQRSDLTLALAEEALAERLGQRSEGLDATLERMDVRHVVESVLGVTGLVLSARTPADFAALRGYLSRHTGYDAAWAERAGVVVGAMNGFDAKRERDALRARFGAWLLLLEFVHDLARPPRSPLLVELSAVSKELGKRCHELVVHLRARHAELYAHLATELEPLLDEEARDVRAEDLGRIDTFAFEERIVLAGAIAALRRGEWAPVLAWAKDRAGDASFWLSRDRRRRWAWMLAEEAAELGRAIDAAPRPLDRVTTLDGALERYQGASFRVDRAHRLFEQRWHELRDPQLPHWDELLEVVDLVRRRYRAWADQLARDFTAICAREGFLPDAPLQQRTFFDQVIKPLAQEPEPVAVFMLDALRYEMAEALAEEMRQAGGVVVDLRARLAELPTLTAVGMNALAPVAREGRLDVVTTAGGAIRGFRTGTFAVLDPASRARAMGERAIGEGARLVALDEVVEAPDRRLADWIKKGPKLLVVHGLEIDDAGEAGLGLATFEQTLRKVRAAWHRLSVAGVRTFVLTADHGFLLQDATTTVPATYGKKTDPSRRHVWSPHEVREEGMVPVSLAKLGYENASGYLLLREDTAVYQTARAGATFVHGGNSLQERVIPVLVVKRRRGPGQSSAAYVVEAQPERAVLDTQRLRLRVQLATDTTGSLAYAGPESVRLAIRAKDRPDVAVRVRDAVGARLRGGGLDVSVGAEWAEVFFVLEGPADDRVRLEVHHPDRVENVTPCELGEYFVVVGVAGAPKGARPSDRPPPDTGRLAPVVARVLGWQDAIEDEDFRAVFERIASHTSISEAELVKLVGPRKARTFARQYEGMLSKLPFRVRIEVQGAQKVYVKDGGR